MLSLFAICVALCWTFGVSECELGETEHTDAQGNTHCMKRLSTVLRSANPECSLEEQSLWINVAAQSNEIFYMNAAHWNVTDATVRNHLQANDVTVDDHLQANDVTIDGTLKAGALQVEEGVTTSTLSTDQLIIAGQTFDGLVKPINIATGAIGSSQIDSSCSSEFSICDLHVKDDFRSADGGFSVTDKGYNTVLAKIDGGLIINSGSQSVNVNSNKLLDVKGLAAANSIVTVGAAEIGSHLTVAGATSSSFGKGGPNDHACFWAKGYPLVTDKGARGWENTCGSWASQVGIHAKSSIYTERYLLASDKRIKEKIEAVPDNIALRTIRRLDAKYYFYKAKLERGFKRTIGFLAQDVLEHIPEAVMNITDYIPDRLQVLDNVRWTETSEGWQMVVDGLGVGNYRFYMSNDNDESEKLYELETEDGKTFLVPKKYTSVFLYGRQVDDFLSLSKDKIWAVAYAALQQVDKNQQVLQEKVLGLESTVNELSQRLANLENQ